jgi:hypothetical protein
MKFYAVIWILAFVVACSPNKQKQPTTKSAGVTTITFDEEMHNFGQLQAGEMVVYTFVFTNTGKNDLQIDTTETDCGCVQVNVPEPTVKPGQKGRIEVEFDSSGLFGRQLKTIEIHANCKEPKQLVIFAEVKNEQIEINS